MSCLDFNWLIIQGFRSFYHMNVKPTALHDLVTKAFAGLYGVCTAYMFTWVDTNAEHCIISLNSVPFSPSALNSANIIQLRSGITCGRMLNGEVYAQKFQMSIYLHLFTDCFMKISPQSCLFRRLRRNLYETVCK